MNVLFLCHRMPYPPNKGDKIRSYNELAWLARRHAVHAAFLVDDPRDLDHLPALGALCAGMDHAVINPRLRKLATLPHLLGGMPLSVPYFHSPALQAAVDRRLEQGDVDAVFCFSSPMAEYVFRSRALREGRQRGAKRPRLIMDFVDVDSDKWRLYAESAGFPQRFIYGREARTLAAYDCRVAGEFDASLFVSAREVEIFRALCPGVDGNRVLAMANGVDVEYFGDESVAPAAVQGAPVLVFLGAMDYYPNEDGVEHFVRDCWPAIRAAQPQARFCIVGSRPTERVLALGQVDGVTVTGFVPDVRPWLRAADIFVAPLRLARGVQNKVLEAMAAGLPVVTRPEAVQGVPELADAVRVAADAPAFAAAVLELAAGETLRRDLGRRGQDMVRAGYRWETNLELLDRLLEGNG